MNLWECTFCCEPYIFVSFYVAGVESEEVEVKGFGYLLEQFAIDIGPSVNFANVA